MSTSIVTNGEIVQRLRAQLTGTNADTGEPVKLALHGQLVMRHGEVKVQFFTVNGIR